MRPRSPRFKQLSVEWLETRQMLAGNVTVRVSGGDLVLQGDAKDNVLAITAGSTAGSVVVTGLADAQGLPTKINGLTGGVQFRKVTGSIFANLGDGNDELGLTKLRITRDLNITDEAGDASIHIGRDPSGAADTPLGQVPNGPVKIGGNLSVTTGGGTDYVAIGDFGGRTLPGQSVNVAGSITVSLGSGGSPGFFDAGDLLQVGRSSGGPHFAVGVGKDFSADLGSGVGTLVINSLNVAGSLRVASSNVGTEVSARVVVGNVLAEDSSPTALKVGGDADIDLGFGPGAVEMGSFVVQGSLNINLPSLARYSASSFLYSYAWLSQGTVGGNLDLSLGTADVQVTIFCVSAKNLSIVGSAGHEYVEIGSTDAGVRSLFETMTIDLLGGDDTLFIYGTTVAGLADLNGGAGSDNFSSGDFVTGRTKLVGFEP